MLRRLEAAIGYQPNIVHILAFKEGGWHSAG
jgi:hypothetical protein